MKQPILHPIRIVIPNSLFSPDVEEHSVCLFCKSNDKENIDSFLKDNPIRGLNGVISLNQVRKLYSAFKDRKKLLSSYTHFVCDENIYSHLCNLLGKTFGSRNNYPLPIRYSKIPGLPSAIDKAVSSTYMYLKGKSISIRFASTRLSVDEIIDNVVKGLEDAVTKFPQHGKYIESIHIKLSDSPSLPIYSKKPTDTFQYVIDSAKDIPSPQVKKSEKKSEKAVNVKKPTNDSSKASTGVKESLEDQNQKVTNIASQRKNKNDDSSHYLKKMKAKIV
jgi:hypothetical protein